MGGGRRARTPSPGPRARQQAAASAAPPASLAVGAGRGPGRPGGCFGGAAGKTRVGGPAAAGESSGAAPSSRRPPPPPAARPWSPTPGLGVAFRSHRLGTGTSRGSSEGAGIVKPAGRHRTELNLLWAGEKLARPAAPTSRAAQGVRHPSCPSHLGHLGGGDRVRGPRGGGVASSEGRGAHESLSRRSCCSWIGRPWLRCWKGEGRALGARPPAALHPSPPPSILRYFLWRVWRSDCKLWSPRGRRRGSGSPATQRGAGRGARCDSTWEVPTVQPCRRLMPCCIMGPWRIKNAGCCNATQLRSQAAAQPRGLVGLP